MPPHMSPPSSADAPQPRSAIPLLLGAGTAQMVLLAALAWWPGATFPFPAAFLFLTAFAAYLLAAVRIKDAVGGGMLIWVFAILMRALFLPLEPELSDDVYRYLWDGHLQRSAVNPYVHAPSSPEVAELHTPWHARVDNPDAPTPHPPLAQVAFLLVALAGGAVFQAKLLWLGLDLATGWLLGRVARLTGRSRRLTQLLYLWSPLLLVEVAWNGHLEPLGLFFLVLIILLARTPVGAGAATALAALVKLAPLAAVPALTRRLGPRFLAGFAVAFVLLYLPYVGAGRRLVAGLVTYVGTERYMEGPFLLLESALPSGSAALWAAGMVVLGVAAWATLQRFRPERALFWVLGAGLLLTPALHPWYVLWILPLAALRVSHPWILMSGLAFLGYYGLDAFHATGDWPQPSWLRAAVWLPVLALLVRDAAVLWRERVPLPPPHPPGP